MARAALQVLQGLAAQGHRHLIPALPRILDHKVMQGPKAGRDLIATLLSCCCSCGLRTWVGQGGLWVTASLLSLLPSILARGDTPQTASLAPGTMGPRVNLRLESLASNQLVGCILASGQVHGGPPALQDVNTGPAGLMAATLSSQFPASPAHCHIQGPPDPALTSPSLFRDFGVLQLRARSPPWPAIICGMYSRHPPFLSSSSLGNKEARLSRRGGDSDCCRDRKVGGRGSGGLFQRLEPRIYLGV